MLSKRRRLGRQLLYLYRRLTPAQSTGRAEQKKHLFSDRVRHVLREAIPDMRKDGKQLIAYGRKEERKHNMIEIDPRKGKVVLLVQFTTINKTHDPSTFSLTCEVIEA